MQLYPMQSLSQNVKVAALPNDRRVAFLSALADLDDDHEGERHARLLEQVISTSRCISADDGLLPTEAQATLLRLRDRYRLLAPTGLTFDPITYRAARRLIEALFF